MHLVLYALLFLATESAWADWFKVQEAKGIVFYVDLTTLRMDGNFRRVLELQDLPTRSAMGELSRKIYSEFDCKEERSRLLTISIYSGAMATQTRIWHISKPSEWIYDSPDTTGWNMLKMICRINSSLIQNSN